jgi:hypothetical protein
MKPERAKMPGAIVGYIISLRLHQVNFVVMLIPTDNPKTEAFRASEGLNVHGFSYNYQTWILQWA